MSKLEVDDRELATILAALRGYQDENAPARPGGRGADRHLDDIATDGGKLKAMGRAEISALCERLNARACGHRRQTPAPARGRR